jgi:hypothetical protein
MNTKSNCGITNSCNVKIIDPATGKIKSEKTYYNVTTNTGRASLAQRLLDSANTAKLGVFQYGAVGTSTTAAAITDTLLGAETYRVAIDMVICSRTNAVLTCQFAFTTGWSGTIYEAGIFIDASATASTNTGTLLVRSVFAGETKTASEHLLITWTISLINV